MEKSKRNVAALLYVTTSPHLPRTQTRIKPTKSLPEHHHSLWGLVGCPTIVEAPVAGCVVPTNLPGM